MAYLLFKEKGYIKSEAIMLQNQAFPRQKVGAFESGVSLPISGSFKIRKTGYPRFFIFGILVILASQNDKV